MLSFISQFLFIVMMRNLVLNSAAQVQTTINVMKNSKDISKYLPRTTNKKLQASTNVNEVPSREEIEVSPWISFAGCGYGSFSKYATHTKVQDYFRQVFENESLNAENKYDCAVKCSSYEGANYAVYVKTVCQCINNLDEPLDTKSNYCVDECSSFYDYYCQAENGLLIFVIERKYVAQIEDMPNVSVHDLDSMTHLNCLVVAKGRNHTTPIKYCSQKLKNVQYDSIDDSFIFKLSNRYLQWVFNQIEDYGGRIYFRVLFRKHKNSIDIGTITDRYDATFRSESNDIFTIMDRYGATSSSDTMDNVTDIPFRHDAMLLTDLCIKLIIGVAAFLGTVIVFLLVVVYILRRTLRKASYTCLTVRRDQNTYNEITTHLSDADQYHEILPLSEMSASGSRPPRSPSIDRKQNVDSSGYLILSSSFKRNEKQCDST